MCDRRGLLLIPEVKNPAQCFCLHCEGNGDVFRDDHSFPRSSFLSHPDSRLSLGKKGALSQCKPENGSTVRAPWEMLICVEQRVCRSWGPSNRNLLLALTSQARRAQQGWGTPAPFVSAGSSQAGGEFPAGAATGASSWEPWGGTRPVPDMPLAPGDTSLPWAGLPF